MYIIFAGWGGPPPRRRALPPRSWMAAVAWSRLATLRRSLQTSVLVVDPDEETANVSREILEKAG